MTPRPYTEDDLVQQTTAKCLEERLGWKSVYAHNREDFGPDSLLGRNSDREVVLTRPLRAALAALNPGLPGAAYDDAVRQLVATDASKSIVAAYNREKDRATIERTFEELLKLVRELDREELRAVREGLDEESLALFDLLCKDRLTRKERARVKEVAVGLLEVVKVEIRRVSQWREKEATRDTVRSAIRDFLWDDATGLPSPRYSDDEVQARVDEVYRHIFRAYPGVPSPYYETDAAA